MSTLIEKLAAEGQLTPEQVEDIGERVSEFMMAVVDDPSFQKEAMEKLGFDPVSVLMGTASSGGGMNTRRLMGAMAVTGLAAGAANLASFAADKITGSIQKAQGYKAMVADNPHLKKMDAKAVQRAYNTLHTVNPVYARDPMIAGQFVSNTIDQEGVNLDAVKNMVDAYSKMPGQKQPGVLRAMGDPRVTANLLTNRELWNSGNFADSE